jgi:pSer/pThr/pTyr-binding forkhead associated (FHA) protein
VLSWEGKRHEVTKRSVVLGRSKDADVQVNDPNVSRRHAELRPRGDQWMIADLGSTNGVTVNGQRIEQAQLLRAGDRIEVGTTRMTFELE